MQVYDVVVIGAGPAGAVAAAYLNKMKKNVLVLEKETFPRFVIGESLLPHCMDHLEEADLLETVKKKLDFKKKQELHFIKKMLNVIFYFRNNIQKVGNGRGK